MTLPKIGTDGKLERGGHRVSLHKLFDDGPLTHRQCSDVMRQSYIELALLDPPLCDIEGDEIIITDAGRSQFR